MTEHLQEQLSIYTARGDIAQPVRIREPIEDGLKLVISNIEMDLQAGNLQNFVSISFGFVLYQRHKRFAYRMKKLKAAHKQDTKKRAAARF